MGRYNVFLLLFAIILMVMGHRRQSNKFYGAGVAVLILYMLWS